MSSRLMPPKVGSRLAMISTSFSGSFSLISMSNTSMPENFLNKTALPSITGLLARGPMSPRPSPARPLVTTPTTCPPPPQIPRAGVREGRVRVLGDLFAGRGHAGRIGQRQIMLVQHLLGGSDG